MSGKSNHKNGDDVQIDRIMMEDQEKALYKALAFCKTPEDFKSFLIDLTTPKELSAMAERWLIARLLETGSVSYRDVSVLTGASTTTVGRVSRFLQQEEFGGYKFVLDALNNTKTK